MKTYIVTVDDYGTKRWYLDDKYHRVDGPALEYTDGSKEWYLNGKLHRTDGPAVDWVNGEKSWWLNNKEYTEADWRKRVQKKVKATCVDKVVEIDGVKYKLVEA
jgi:hypothetical protein